MTAAIIVAAGKSARMGARIDKLFFDVAGRPLVAHTWERLASSAMIDEIVVVVRDGTQAAFEKIGNELRVPKPFRLAVGGTERQDSVWNGLQVVSPHADVVLIQDGARPCTPHDLIVKTIEVARTSGAAVAAQRVTDTIKRSEDGKHIAGTVERALLWSVQTPQTFQTKIIRAALAEVRRRGLQITDDTAACELIGQPVVLVGSQGPNPKATCPADLSLVEWLIRRQASAEC
ncbi:MAG: 2-C-methyl-D-erythritol 4-phosphate cytidylyltransferase [Verrucomicrobiia bacterium]